MKNSLQDWLQNDPEPMKTLDLVKRKIDWKKKMSAEDPIGLMRAILTKQEFDDFWENKRLLETDFLLNKGYSQDKTLKASWYVPEVVTSCNPEHWDIVFRGKQYIKYPYFLLGSPISGAKAINVKSRFQY